MTTKPFSIDDIDRLIDENAVHNLHRFAKTIENLFKSTDEPKKNVYPCPFDLSATDNEYIITFDIPGVSKESIKLHINTQNQLDVKVNRETNDHLNYLRRHRPCGDFAKIVPLPKDIDSKHVEAKYENGVLIVEVKRSRPDVGYVQNISIL